LVVRFGLHPLLYRQVGSLSTGEIRKVLLARALSRRPALLILDNAFDGLDVPSRAALAELISQTLRGFGQLLVQGIDAKATAHTQVLMLTHRAEDIVDEIQTVSFFDGNHALTTLDRAKQPAEALIAQALMSRPALPPLPTTKQICDIWGAHPAPEAVNGALVEAKGLQVSRGDQTILQELEWRIGPEQNWLVSGGNGLLIPFHAWHRHSKLLCGRVHSCR
jgi:molybdate transport system ATP-binding protein